MNAPFYDALEHVFRIEGGFSDDPQDSGGATQWGITEAQARASGYEGPMSELPKATAAAIYRRSYWDAVRADDLHRIHPALALEVFDTAVNTGTGRAVEFLQRALNVLNREGRDYPDLKTDGSIGPKTLAALKSYASIRRTKGLDVLVQMLNVLQGAFYVELAERRQKDERFIFGWFVHRVTIN